MSIRILNQTPDTPVRPPTHKAVPAEGSPATAAQSGQATGMGAQISVDSKGKEKKKSSGCGASSFSSFGLIIVMFVAFYFLLIRPQQKRQKEHNEMLNKLQKGDRVVTSGGLLGTITALTDRYATLDLGNQVKVRVLRSHIAGTQSIGKDDATKAAKPSGKKKNNKSKHNA